MDQQHWGTLISVFDAVGINITPLTKGWSSVYRKVERHNGRKFAVMYMKQLSTIGERYALHQEITPLPFRKSNAEGLPKDLYFMKKYLRGSTRKRIAALSVLRTVEDLRLPISKDISTVTQPCILDNNTLKDVCDFIPFWVDKLNKPIKLDKMKYHYTQKNGPNGHALENSNSDIGALLEDPKLFGAIQVVQEQLKDRYPLTEAFQNKSGGIHSKLTQFPEKAGKTRTIAVVDYYSQRSLKPLHKGLMSLLREMVSDGTYSHRSIGTYAQQLTKEKSFIACYDISAFTDRVPAELQRVLLHELLKENPALASAFWTLLAERQFTVAWSGDKVSYGCGQPMGAYGSWALCSLTHHLLVEYCANKTGKFQGVKHKYRLIGDDIVIKDVQISIEYEKLLSALGVEINLSKTVKSEASAEHSAAEVAKQLFLNGNNLSPITPGLIRSLRNPMLVSTALESLCYLLDIIPREFPASTLPRLLPKGDSLRKGLVLLTNPLTGAMRLPENQEVNIDGSILSELYQTWNAYDIDEVKACFYKIRFEKLMEIAESTAVGILVLPSPDGGYTIRADWQLGTNPLEAKCLAAQQIMSEITDAQMILEELMFTDFEEDLEDVELLLQEVEFLDDPEKPFLARKDRREIQRSSMIIELMTTVEQELQPI